MSGAPCDPHVPKPRRQITKISKVIDIRDEGYHYGDHNIQNSVHITNNFKTGWLPTALPLYEDAVHSKPRQNDQHTSI